MSHKTQNIIGLGIIGSIVLFCFTVVASTSARSNPEELLRQAQEKYEEAKRESCEEIGSLILDCYSGKSCDPMHKGSADFTNNFSETHEVACPSAHSKESELFGEGDE